MGSKARRRGGRQRQLKELTIRIRENGKVETKIQLKREQANPQRVQPLLDAVAVVVPNHEFSIRRNLLEAKSEEDELEMSSIEGHHQELQETVMDLKGLSSSDGKEILILTDADLVNFLAVESASKNSAVLRLDISIADDKPEEQPGEGNRPTLMNRLARTLTRRSFGRQSDQNQEGGATARQVAAHSGFFDSLLIFRAIPELRALLLTGLYSRNYIYAQLRDLLDGLVVSVADGFKM